MLRLRCAGGARALASGGLDYIGDALHPLRRGVATDYFFVPAHFSEAEWERFIAIRRFVDHKVLPVINEYWERAVFPWPLVLQP